MSDIIEYALERYTDFTKFERLANTVLQEEMYAPVRPVGGIDDDGIDAEVVKYFKDAEERQVFQYTIQKNLTSKISDTIKKIKENKIKAKELIVVTPNSVTNIQHHRRKARKEHGFSLEIIERETFMKVLGQSENGIFKRFFPDIKGQLETDLVRGTSAFSVSSDDSLENTMLKCSLLFSFNPRAIQARKSLFDHAVFALILDSPGKPKEELRSIFAEKYGRAVPAGELDASLARLRKEKRINKGEPIVPTAQASTEILGNLARVNQSAEKLISAIVRKTKKDYGKRVDAALETALTQNIKNSLSAYFRLYGLEYARDVDAAVMKFGFSSNDDLIALAKHKLPEQAGHALVFAIGDTIKKPTDEEAETLANWSKAFIGVQIMGLDPKLSEFQVSAVAKKTFIVDTDFLLYVLTPECPESSTYQEILSDICEFGCRVVIPEEVVLEVIKHAEYAPRNYNYLQNTFSTVDAEIVDTKVGNIFLKGFYYEYLRGENDGLGFKQYLENYYDPHKPYRYMMELIKHLVPAKVEILGVDDAFDFDLNHEELSKLEELIFSETWKTQKGTYRDEDENREIASLDAKIYLYLHYSNGNEEVNPRKVLAGNHHMLSASRRAYWCAKKLGYNSNYGAHPRTMLQLLERIGKFAPSAREFVNLFDNPFLIEAVNSSWENIKSLVDAGVDLKGRNVVRMRWDLDEEVSKFLEERNSFEERLDPDSPQESRSYLEKMEMLRSKGYKLIPEIQDVLSQFEELQRDYQDQVKVNEELSGKIEKFGKRRQAYLERINQGTKKKGWKKRKR
jgi:hypothetical protein